MADPYTALGASPGATDEELRQQYLALTRQYPPEQMRIVQEGFDKKDLLAA